jgi:lipoprotein-releasing system ATP-binding protein
MNAIIKLKNLKKFYGDNNENLVLKGIDLEIERGSLNAIIGQSGSGKSTLLNIIGTLDTKSSGEVIIDDIEMGTLKKDQIAEFRNKEVGFVFQFHHLLPEFTALENVLMPYLISGYKVNKETMDRAMDLMRRMGLEAVMNNKGNAMSGGQQQRTAIARALMNNPKILLADEPTGNLDSDTSEDIYKLFTEINKEFKTTIIVITHDDRIANKADRIIEIKDGMIKGI